LGRKRLRHSPRTFNWMSILALVEVQLVLRCLDARSRLTAARCNKQLYAAVNHPFAWPQEQMATLGLGANTDVVALQSLGGRVRGSLLRLASIRLRVWLSDEIDGPLCPELFAVPNVQSITLQPEQDGVIPTAASESLLPLLRHPAAQQLRSLDISGL
jgi:hypothetical protein